MRFELLPNEILLDLFNYLDGIDLLRAFYDLNSRFNLLLYKQFRAYRFNFSSCSKYEFDMICQEHLPFITDQVIYLTLSNWQATLGQINLFFSYIPSISQLTHLRSLTLFNLRSYRIPMEIVNQLHHLRDLTHLTFHGISCYNDQGDFQIIINNIWSLPKLIYCCLDVHGSKQSIFSPSTKLSTSLSNVCITGYSLKWNEIYQLFQFTSALKYLAISIQSNDDNDCKPFLCPTLIDLRICTFRINDISELISFFRNLPNLRRLSIHFLSRLINGYQWEKIIRDYLSNLKVFQLKMRDEISLNENVEERANELINSFQNSFWIDEHQWFVRCFIYGQTIHLETLSKLYVYFEKKLPNWWKSTDLDDNEKTYYSSISSIYCETFFHQSIPSYIRLHNIDYLCIQFPIPDEFWSVVLSLDKLRSLIVSSYTDTFQYQLQTLLDRAQHLHHLEIRQKESLSSQISLFQYTNPSVCQLTLRDFWYNEEDCLRLCHSPFGIQCKVLTIQVKNHQSIIILLNNMKNLQALHVVCGDDPYSKQFLPTENPDESKKDEIIQWLIDHLPSCYFIVRDSYPFHRIQIWIE